MAVDLDEIARERFRIPALHPFQREAIGALLEPDGRVLLVAPTGGGKSLCYQLPALITRGTTVVVSPLISLMEDQVRSLEARGLSATYLASNLPREEAVKRLLAFRRRELDIVYVSPERLGFDGFLSAASEAEIGLVAIDEAHCIVQWGHDFRPDYLRIGGFLARARPPRILACTATATPDARSEILTQLGWSESDTVVVLRGFARPNLHLEVRHLSGPKDAIAEIDVELRRALVDPEKPAGAAIVYAATRKNVERLAVELCQRGYNAKAYHAGLDPSTRAAVSTQFADGWLSVVVATNAFGMGIDRSDVRAVVHAQPPASLEAYYQEVGRAGRDGLDARGLLLLAPADVALRRRLCELGSDGEPPEPLAVERAWKLFRELLNYVDAATCRHDSILRYFGDEAESLGGCGHCDVCLDAGSAPDDSERALDVVRRALAGVARARQGAGLGAIQSMLRGETSSRLSKLGLDRLTTFGVLSSSSEAEVAAIMRALIAAGWIDFTTRNQFSLPFVTRTGWAVMTGAASPPFRLPRVAGKRASAMRGARKPARGASKVRARVGAAPAEVAPLSADGERLFEALRARRGELAKEKKVPAYVVAHDRTLREMASARPRSREELSAVRGLGPSRLDEYGEAWLEVVAAFDV